MFRHAYSRFLGTDPERLHFAAHSHHFWPDCTREAQLRYWDDSALWADRKWEHVFSEVIPSAQKHVSRILGLSNPHGVVFAPNTHELVTRLLSCFDPTRKLRVLTTDGEFHSFTRQIGRYEELPNVAVDRVATEPFGDLGWRFAAQAAVGDYDLVFVSHVFFDSGVVFDGIPELVERLRDSRAILAIDGYHAFAAIPVDLSGVEDRVFYVAGGYKYAQAGEGACFMHVPPRCTLRPLDTGWFAEFAELERGTKGRTRYGADGSRFWGSTFDSSGLYRFNAAMDWWQRDGVTVEAVHRHVQSLQRLFLDELALLRHPDVAVANLIGADRLENHGHFLTFKTPQARSTRDRLLAKNIVVDHRGDRLRFGFGLYHDESDVKRLLSRLRGDALDRTK